MPDARHLPQPPVSGDDLDLTLLRTFLAAHRAGSMTRAAAELGLSIPGDVSVMGYDDHPMSGLLSPGLTTVDWDIDGIVRAAVRLVTAAADGGARRRRVVQKPTLRERGSVARRSGA